MEMMEMLAEGGEEKIEPAPPLFAPASPRLASQRLSSQDAQPYESPRAALPLPGMPQQQHGGHGRQEFAEASLSVRMPPASHSQAQTAGMGSATRGDGSVGAKRAGRGVEARAVRPTAVRATKLLHSANLWPPVA